MPRKHRYRLAWMVDQCSRSNRKYVDTDKAPVRAALSAHVVDLLSPLFFSTDKDELLTASNIQSKFSNYTRNTEAENLVCALSPSLSLSLSLSTAGVSFSQAVDILFSLCMYVYTYIYMYIYVYIYI